MKVYNTPSIEIIKIDTRDIMSESKGILLDPFKSDIFFKD